ncbi:hypothetical protein [Sphingopyxis sp.]|uniref:hypothetical protein n=1 Tax=Sphingopyxis sp. TaxID=1908224 RepID=UPI003BAC7E5E
MARHRQTASVNLRPCDSDDRGAERPMRKGRQPPEADLSFLVIRDLSFPVIPGLSALVNPDLSFLVIPDLSVPVIPDLSFIVIPDLSVPVIPDLSFIVIPDLSVPIIPDFSFLVIPDLIRDPCRAAVADPGPGPR